MVTIDTLKPGDTWACPKCHRPITMYTGGAVRGSLRAHKAGGGTCDGTGYGPFRRAFPQEMRVFGRDEAIARVRDVHGMPDWEPPVYAPGDLQEFVAAVWPQAKSFTIVGSGDRRGLVFTVGSRRWHYATHDCRLSGRCDFQADALDAFDEHEKRNSSV
ncbi:hypothetical protein [Streptomyces sp. NPDC088727]|uniref:hypothetical protein n=1 Tax=Streptomyces sp. NPDC088727 TaxID=3365875 RepID=UPI00382E6FF7